MAFETFELIIENHVAQVVFNRPERANALNQKAWDEMKAIFEELDENEPMVHVKSIAVKQKD